ncbi:MAG: TolC family protein [Polyangiaceae bacterium]
MSERYGLSLAPRCGRGHKEQELARRKITDVKLQFVPTIDLQSTLSTSTPTTGVSPATLWNIQAVFSWAIWEGGARYGALKTTRAQADQADLQRESLERQVVVSVAQAQRAVSVAEQKVQVAALSRDSAAKIDQMTQKTFRAGLSTSLELVSAAAALRQAELNLAVAEFGLVNSRIALALAMARCPL